MARVDIGAMTVGPVGQGVVSGVGEGRKRLNEELEERVANQTNITFGSLDLHKDRPLMEKEPGI